MAPAATEDRILDVAQQLMQTRGYGGFSYQDVAAELGVTKPAVHYHFAAKADLGLAVTRRYRTSFAAELRQLVDTVPDPRRRLQHYARLYAATLQQGRVCLCGLLAADTQVVPEPIREEARAFFADHVEWLSATLRELGITAAAARRRAEVMIAGLEGALMIAALRHDPAFFESSAAELIRVAAAR